MLCLGLASPQDPPRPPDSESEGADAGDADSDTSVPRRSPVPVPDLPGDGDGSSVPKLARRPGCAASKFAPTRTSALSRTGEDMGALQPKLHGARK
jgi:hypothetical protein